MAKLYSNKRNNPSSKRLLVISFFAFVLFTIWENNNSLQSIIWSDTEGYYMYLPAIFIYKDVHKVKPRSMNFRTNEKGEIVMKYTCGVSYFYLPFFLAAHLYCNILHLDNSGFSAPYAYAIMLCALFWGFIGLYVLSKLLRKYFGPSVTDITLLCLMLGTNLFFYMVRYGGMSHVYSFTLFAATIFLTDNYYKDPTKNKIILIGLLLGLITLIRPTNCILIIFLFLYRIKSRIDFFDRITFFKKNYSHIISALPFFFLPMIPQFIYWKEMTEHWITYSYKGEGFIYWKNPKIASVLFDTENGLFIYSPILFFMAWGFIIGRKDIRNSFIAALIVFVIITYLFASWWTWTFGAAYGHRCYVEYYTILASPFAIAIEKILSLKAKLLKALIFAVMILFSYYNIRMSLLIGNVSGWWSGPDWRWHWDTWWNVVKMIF